MDQPQPQPPDDGVHVYDVELYQDQPTGPAIVDTGEAGDLEAPDVPPDLLELAVALELHEAGVL